MSETRVIECGDLDATIEEYKLQGYRLDMIFPADSPREALMSGVGGDVRLRCRYEFQVPSSESGDELETRNLEPGTWKTGRAGMEYRDLIPDRVSGKVIASHIRLLEDGPVADYVHYHKVEFQMIYCLKGRIQVVYEDQGPPFWLESGDCVVQPPEIRHRVLFAEGGAEVLEVTMPAEHETWVDHQMVLPNGTFDTARRFNGQPFVRTRKS